MCPVCLATAAILASSATGTGGLTAVVAGVILKRKKQREFPTTETTEVNRGNHSDGNQESEDRITH